MEHKVVSKTPDGRTREHFVGNEEDAHNYVVANFPRPHVEPGSVGDRLRGDVQVVGPNGVRREYHGDAGWVDIDDNDQIVGSNDEEVEEVEPEEVQ